MTLEARLTRLIRHPAGGLLAADIEGRLHHLAADLEHLRSSCRSGGSGSPSGTPIYAVTVAGPFAYTRDKIGNICRWRLSDLALLNRLDAVETCDRGLLMPDEEPSPTILRGIGVWGGRLYVNNGYFQLVVVRLGDFTVERIVPWPYGERRLEWFCTDRPGQQAVADREGNVYLGSLGELDLPVQRRIDAGNVHRLLYDPRHDRYLATLDSGLGENWHIANGIAAITPDGELDQLSLWARNDVECLELSPDAARVYTGGFDNVLQIYDNRAPELTIDATVEGFSHQVIDCCVSTSGAVHVLSQDGEVVELTEAGRFVRRMGYQRQCVWDICPHPRDPDVFLVATDDGVQEVSLRRPEQGPSGLVHLRTHVTGLGFTRRLVPLVDGWCGVAWDRTVFRCSLDGDVLWSTALDSIVHTLAVSPDGRRLLLATNAGAREVAIEDGRPQREVLTHRAPTWVAGYAPDGDRIVGVRTGPLRRVRPDGTLVWECDLGNYPKRLEVLADRVRVAGGGGVKEVMLADGRWAQTWCDLLDNTVENGVQTGSVVCCVSYGMQLAVYDEASAALLALAEDLPDFPKGMAVCTQDGDVTHLVVGGRGGYLRLYRVERRPGADAATLAVVSDLWLPGVVPSEQPVVRRAVGWQAAGPVPAGAS